MSAWINGRQSTAIDWRDRGLQYGDGVFETMRVRGGTVRLLDYHLERLCAGCKKLQIPAPAPRLLRREIDRAAAVRREGIVKLIVTRGCGPRGYRPSGGARGTRIVTQYPLARGARREAAIPVRIRVCATRLGHNPALAGLKTLNRLESVMACAEWRNPRVWDGLMRDVDENIVCGTMSNLFLKRGSLLMTPALDRCGVAGVMRRWVLERAHELQLRPVERRIRWRDLVAADEVFMTNAVVGMRSVAVIECGRKRLRFMQFDAAEQLRLRLDPL
ncbi:MAG: aminodeoxychorismate lyase [Pseudomonadota bacterium]|nr:aminodeoxychorismate lyase [Pseudomonadota bacterium]